MEVLIIKMADKKLGPIVVDERVCEDTENIVTGLENLAKIASDSLDLREIISNAISLLFEQLPNGDKNYGQENPRIGRVYTDNRHEVSGRLDLLYTDSGYRESHCKFIQVDIARINLRTRTAELEWKPGQYRRRKSYQIPAVVRRDSEYVLKRLGLSLSGPRVSDD